MVRRYRNVAQRGLDSPFSQLGDASSVLLLTPSLDPRDEEGCTALLRETEPSDANVLHVTYGGSPDDRLDVWKRRVGDQLPNETAIVSVGEGNRAAVTARTGTEQVENRVALEFVSDPGDLTGLGMRITERLGAWTDTENRIVVCFHSVTALLQYADLERAYRFLHVLTGHFDAADALVHFHMDPGAHDEKTVNTMKTLMDGVVEADDGGWTVTTR